MNDFFIITLVLTDMFLRAHTDPSVQVFQIEGSELDSPVDRERLV